MKLPSMILASASPRRAELLQEMGLKFRIVPSGSGEFLHEHLSPAELCQLNAYHKARIVAKRHPDHLVLGADTLVSLGTKLFGKPANLSEAEAMLLQLAGTRHVVTTGVCLIHLRAHRQRTFAATSAVTFRPLSRADVQGYLKQSDPLDKAGGYAIQEKGDLLVERLDGSYANVVGLPVEQLQIELRHFEQG